MLLFCNKMARPDELNEMSAFLMLIVFSLILNGTIPLSSIWVPSATMASVGRSRKDAFADIVEPFQVPKVESVGLLVKNVCFCQRWERTAYA